MQLIAGAGHREFGVLLFQCGIEFRHQIQRQKGGVAGCGDDQRMRGFAEAAVQAGEWTDKTTDRVGNDAVSKCLILFNILVGVDQQFIDLWGEAFDDVLGHRFAAQQLQALVDAAHAPALAAGEEDAGDFFFSAGHIRRPACG